MRQRGPLARSATGTAASGRVTGSSRMPAQELLDVDSLAAAAVACPAVARLHPGGTKFVATYLPGRRIVGVRVDDDRVLVSTVLSRGASVSALENQVRGALSPLVGGRQIDVHVADVDIGEPPEAPPAGEPT